MYDSENLTSKTTSSGEQKDVTAHTVEGHIIAAIMSTVLGASIFVRRGISPAEFLAELVKRDTFYDLAKEVVADVKSGASWDDVQKRSAEALPGMLAELTKRGGPELTTELTGKFRPAAEVDPDLN